MIATCTLKMFSKLLVFEILGHFLHCSCLLWGGVLQEWNNWNYMRKIFPRSHTQEHHKHWLALRGQGTLLSMQLCIDNSVCHVSTLSSHCCLGVLLYLRMDSSFTFTLYTKFRGLMSYLSQQTNKETWKATLRQTAYVGVLTACLLCVYNN